MPCIMAMRKNSIGFELNTSGWNRQQKKCYPNADILKFLSKVGIDKVTLGSGLHELRHLGYMLKQGMSVLKEHGFSRLCTFTKRT